MRDVWSYQRCALSKNLCRAFRHGHTLVYLISYKIYVCHKIQLWHHKMSFFLHFNFTLENFEFPFFWHTLIYFSLYSKFKNVGILVNLAKLHSLPYSSPTTTHKKLFSLSRFTLPRQNPHPLHTPHQTPLSSNAADIELYTPHQCFFLSSTCCP